MDITPLRAWKGNKIKYVNPLWLCIMCWFFTSKIKVTADRKGDNSPTCTEGEQDIICKSLMVMHYVLVLHKYN